MKPYPFKMNQPQAEKIFNYRLSRCRRVIENAFGQLKARFRKLGKGLEVKPRNWQTIIRACCLLHNFLKDENDEVCESWLEEARVTMPVQPVAGLTVPDTNIEGKSVRDAIAASFCKYECIKGIYSLFNLPF